MIRRPSLDPRWLSALGVLSAGLLLNEVNIYAARHHVRWDLSHEARYTLSPESKRLLEEIDEPITITVIKSTELEASVELRQLLASYETQSARLQIVELDPDRQPTELISLLSQLEAGADALSADFASDAALVVQSKARTWLVRQSALSKLDEEGRVVSTIEAAITEAIAQVLQQEKLRICFVTGHGELSLDDESESGLASLRRLLVRNNFEVERAPMDLADPGDSLRGCDGLALVAPNRPLPPEDVEILANAASKLQSLLVFVDPIVDRQGKLENPNLGGLAPLLGAQVQPAFVLENDAQAVPPGSMGEVFFARAKVHPLTRGLTTDTSRTDARVLLSAASPLELTLQSTAQVVLETSERGEVLTDLGTRHDSAGKKKALPLAVATVADLGQGRVRRSLLVGSSSTLVNESFRNPRERGNSVFSENAFAWAMARPTMVTVPARPLMSAGLTVSEESLSSLLRYVLVYLPLAALSLGATVLFRRNRAEQRFRASQQGERSR